ncbi:tripartite tricarboxylate transporter substrate binding protein [Bordetella hinzii]|uniref:tripartite tricarboxylate transporter substrate binding protein n=1 Tax=Bordetella hinzii TaxID=103855 RepID=UPI0013EFF5FB|nr:tripartite tricarboxylate transporter substrate binding protein [Bordetella hinzii]QII85449.1 tripartite tricarboxylate transporter substrate binding protein [Bordetella hinzii]
MPRLTQLALTLLGTCLMASAQAAEPIRLIVPTTAGGGTDGFFRVLAKDAEPQLGGPVVVVNVGGAGGSIGVTQMVRSAPDGNTVAGVWLGPVTVAPHTMPVSYTLQDYIPVAQLTSAPYVMCVQSSFAADDGKALMKTLREAPNRYSFGTDGAGGPGQLAAQRIFNRLDIRQRDIPYKGAGDTLMALLGGHIDLYVGSIPPVLPYVKNGKVKCLQLTSADKVAALPQATSLNELGLGEEQTLLWRGILAPKQTPPERIRVLEQAFTTAAQAPATRRFVEEAGEQVTIVTGEALRKQIEQEYTALGKVAQGLSLTK